MLRWVALASAVVCVVAFAGVIVSRPSMPPSQQEQSAEHNSEHPNKDANKTLWDSWFPDALALYTLALVVFTAVLAFGGLYQLRALERAELISTEAAKAAKESADVARDAVRLAERTAERQLRAYVSVILSEVRRLAPGEVPQVHIVLKNNGQTPAYAAITWDAVSLLDFPNDVFDIDPVIETARGGAVIGPGSEYHITRDLAGPLTFAHFEALASGKFAIYGFGRLKYRDAFNVRRTTNYRIYYGGDKPLNDKGVMSPMADGNDAD
jgi:hypothetical protein